MRKRKTHINIRTTDKEKERFERNAKKCGLSLSEYLRMLANGYEPRAMPPIEYGELIRVLSGMYGAFMKHGKSEYAQQIADVVLTLKEQIAPGKREVKHGYNKNMAGSG